jgi:hypothetical protein
LVKAWKELNLAAEGRRQGFRGYRGREVRRGREDEERRGTGGGVNLLWETAIGWVQWARHEIDWTGAKDLTKELIQLRQGVRSQRESSRGPGGWVS